MKKVLASSSVEKQSNRQKKFPKKNPMLETNFNDFRSGMIMITAAIASVILLNTCDSKGAKNTKYSEKNSIVTVSVEAEKHSKEEEQKHSEN